LRKTLEKQVVAGFGEGDADVWALASRDGFTGAAVLSIRAGSVTGCQPLFADGEPLEDETPRGGGDGKSLADLLVQYYGPENVPPAELILASPPPAEDASPLSEWLRGLGGKRVKISVPKRGDGAKLVGMAAENAKFALEERLSRLAKNRGAMAELKTRLNLPKIPRRVECFDLAHVQGKAATAAMVVMEEGELAKSRYRRFRIKSAKGGDDYGGMLEVVKRRFSKDANDEKWPRPDLLLLDGGKGQINSALRAFRELNLTPPSVAGIAKDRIGGGPDRIFLPGRKNPADLKPGSPGLFALQKLRDEAHRFSRSYHHHLRSEKMTESVFAGIKGLGPARRKLLSAAFATLEDISSASDKEILAAVPIGPEGAERIRLKAREHLKNRGRMSGKREEGPGNETGTPAENAPDDSREDAT
jgi:excinuclease ABC subunit C